MSTSFMQKTDGFSLDSKDALKELFDSYFQEIFAYTVKIIGNREAAEEIVQDIFIVLWEKRDSIQISSSVKGYLLTSAKNRSINYLKKKYVILTDLSHNEVYKVSNSNFSDGEVIKEELESLLIKGLEQMPEKTRYVFSLSRYAGLSHSEIADQIGVSQKTIEYHIANALKTLRTFLENHGYSIAVVSLVFSST